MKRVFTFAIALTAVLLCNCNKQSPKSHTIFSVSSYQSNPFNFGVSHCSYSYTGQLSEVTFNMAIDLSANKIYWGFASLYYSEQSSDAPLSSLIPKNMHKYHVQSATFDGINANINFNMESGRPSCIAQFTGVKSGNSINGNLTIIRTDATCVAFSIPISVTLKQID